VQLNLARGARGEAGVYVAEYMSLREARLQRLPSCGVAFDDGREPDGSA
jgi:hypothetical protein